MDYDRDGLMAAAGSICNPLLTALENISYYAVPYPKSLGREWLEVVFMPVMDKYGISLEDKLRTVTEHAAARIIAAIEDGGTGSKVLVTGGGAKNVFLMDLIAAGTSREIIIPVDTLVNYKEALVFALLGLLRQQGRVNVYASVTGASGDSSSGSIYLP